MNNLSEIYLIQIIKKFALEVIGLESNLFSLTQSEKFQKQIATLFKKFSAISLAPSTFEEIIRNSLIEETDKERLFLIAEIYKKFMNFLAENDYSISKHIFCNEQIPNLKEFIENLKSKTNSIKYFEFNDKQEETIKIAEKIKELNKNSLKIGVLATSNSTQREFLDVFNVLDVAANLILENENILNFRIKIEQIFNLFEIAEKSTEAAEEQKKLLIENLNYEKDFIDELIKLFKEDKEDEIIKNLAQKENIEEIKKFDKLFAYINFSKNVLNLKPEKAIIISFLDKICYRENNSSNIQTEIFSQDLDKEFDYLFIPNLVEGVFVKNSSICFIDENSNKIISQKIKEKHPEFDFVVDNEDEKIDFLKLEKLISCAKNIVLSTNNWQNAKKVNPSVIFELFKKFDNENYEKIETASKQESFNKEKTAILKEDKKIFEENEPLTLSASAIGNFQKCPKKFFFKNILNLKEKGNFQASYGTCVHALLEVLAKKFKENYTSEKLKELVEILFNTKNNIEKTKETGFEDLIIDLILNTEELLIIQMKQKALGAIEELEANGFFTSIPDEFYTEKSFEFTLPEIPNTVFKGRIDLIARYGDRYCVVDFKTGKTPEKPQIYWTDPLTLEFKRNKRGEGIVVDEKLKKAFNYQLPIYHFAVQNAQELVQFRDKIDEYYLQFVRAKEDGSCFKDGVTSSLYFASQDKIIENIRETIVSEIRKTEKFATEESFFCEECEYSFLCDKVEEAE